MGTTIQQSLPETIPDLLFGVMGAAVTLPTILLLRRMLSFSNPRKGPGGPRLSSSYPA